MLAEDQPARVRRALGAFLLGMVVAASQQQVARAKCGVPRWYQRLEVVESQGGTPMSEPGQLLVEDLGDTFRVEVRVSYREGSLSVVSDGNGELP